MTPKMLRIVSAQTVPSKLSRKPKKDTLEDVASAARPRLKGSYQQNPRAGTAEIPGRARLLLSSKDSKCGCDFFSRSVRG